MKKNSKILLIFLALIAIIASVMYFLKPIYVLPKTIWIYWDSLEQPDLIKAIIKYNRSKTNGWDVKILNKNTIYNYVDKNDLPSSFNTLIVQHQADWYRLYLLKMYGGCWLDSSIIINDEMALNNIFNETYNRKSQLSGFITGDRSFKHNSGLLVPAPFDNWFIMAPKNGSLITAWFNEFNKAIQMGFLNYKKKCIADNVDISSIFFTSAEDVYLTQHACIQKILQKDIRVLPPVYFLQSNDSMFKIQQDCKWDNNCIEEALLKNPESKKLPYIKLTRHNRSPALMKYFE